MCAYVHGRLDSTRIGAKIVLYHHCLLQARQMSQPGHNLPTLLQKRPLAPAPPTRFGTSKLSRPVETEQSPLSSSSSSDNEDGDMLLVPRTVPASGYAELEEDPEDAAEAEAEMEDAEENGGDRDEIIRSRVATSQEQMRTIIASLSPEQLQRYETFRRVGFPRPMIKKVMTKVMEGLQGRDKSALAPNASTIIVVAGIAKVFVGELVEEAKLVAEQWNEDGALKPSHILEAQRRLKNRRVIPASTSYKKRTPLF